jgi:hypothetical protein
MGARRLLAVGTIPPLLGFRFLPFNSLPTLPTWGMMHPLPDPPAAGSKKDEKHG